MPQLSVSLRRFGLPPLLAALVLAGCASAPPAPSVPMPETPAAFKEGRWTVAKPADTQARGQWWKAFDEPTLDDLVTRAGQANTSLQTAAARLQQAQALLKAANADRAPQIGAAASAQRTGGGLAQASGTAGTLLSAGATLSYEVDLFGKLAKATDAAALDVESQQSLLRSAQLLVQAQVAQTYFALRALDSERTLVRDTVLAYRESQRLTERRFSAGDVAELDVARVRTEVAATESQAIALDRQRAELEHALAVLVGEPASTFELPPLPNGREALATVPAIPPGVPSIVLTRRPDVAAAQKAMLAAQARVGVAQTAWFPDVSLTANGGFASNDIGDLFKWSARSWGIGALLSLPLFDGGRREAGVQSATAQFDATAAAYRDTVLGAFRDVEDQLSALRTLADQADAQQRAVASASRATVLSDSRYRNGMVSQLELLDAQRSELANRRVALQVRAAQVQATVGLIRALGGGWNAAKDEGALPTTETLAAR